MNTFCVERSSMKTGAIGDRNGSQFDRFPNLRRLRFCARGQFSSDIDAGGVNGRALFAVATQPLDPRARCARVWLVAPSGPQPCPHEVWMQPWTCTFVWSRCDERPWGTSEPVLGKTFRRSCVRPSRALKKRGLLQAPQAADSFALKRVAKFVDL